MADTTIVLSPSDPEWDAWLRPAPHDFYHLASYHAFAEGMGEGRACMVVHGTARQFIAWPYLVRAIGERHADAGSVYGYTGPTGAGLDDAEFLARAWSAIRAVWAGQGLVSLFTRFHPLLGNARICEGLRGEAVAPGGEVLQLGRSVSLDLAYDRDDRRRQYPQVLRQEIKRAERAGLTVEEDRDWSCYSTFIALYRETMEKSGASGRYRFSDDYFHALRRSLGSLGHLATAHVDGEAAAIMLFTVCGDIAEAHLTGVSPRFRRLSPLKGLIDGVADIARSLGATRLHLGAGRGGREDSLFAFKSRFSRLRHDFKLGRWILDKRRYDALILERGAATEMARGYFPAYRAPVPEPADP
jgi:hypothetical protein